MEPSYTSTGKKTGPDAHGPRRPKLWLLILIGMVACLVAAGLGGLIGYNAALAERTQLQTQEEARQATDQYQLALADLAAGRLQIASQRLQYVLQIDPSNSKAAAQLATVQAAIRATQSATPVPSPIPAGNTAAGAGGDPQARLGEIRNLIAAQSWEQALEALDKFRADFPAQDPIIVDGLTYTIYRNLGVSQIIQHGAFESGIYYLRLAERYAPLDRDATKYLNWAQLYLTGMSSWNVNWAQVVSTFSRITPFMGGLRDSNGLTAWERLRQAEIHYGDQLLKQGNPCAAQEQYQSALAAKEDPSVRSALATAQAQCTSTTSEPTQATEISQTPAVPTPSSDHDVQTSPTPIPRTPEPTASLPSAPPSVTPTSAG